MTDIFTAALPTRTSNLRRLFPGVQRAPKFSGGGAEIWQKLRFRPKLALSSELISSARVPDVGALCRGGLPNFRPRPYWGPRHDSYYAECRGISDRHYHTIPGSSFWTCCFSEGGSIDFQGQLFCLPADSRQTLRDFCPCPSGLKVKKIWGGCPPLGGI